MRQLKRVLFCVMMIVSLTGAKRTYTVKSQEEGEALRESRGFGDKEAEVRMMNLMMVGGSGYEGMDMEKMKVVDSKAPEKAAVVHAHGGVVEAPIELTRSPERAKVGANLYEFTVKDPSTRKTLAGLKPTVQVYMTNMDMGTETPPVKERAPGRYEVKASFSMKGPWALKITSTKGEKVFEVAVNE